MQDHLSTRELGWVLGRSAASIRRMIKAGEIKGVLIPGGYRIARDEVLRVSRDHVAAESGRKLSDEELERLIDRVITTDEKLVEP